MVTSGCTSIGGRRSATPRLHLCSSDSFGATAGPACPLGRGPRHLVIATMGLADTRSCLLDMDPVARTGGLSRATVRLLRCGASFLCEYVPDNGMAYD